MSGLHENQKTLRRLRSRIDELKPSAGENFYFVLSWPRSDIGKGTLVAQLLATVVDSDAIKFDGLLNTNANGRHTARGHDDFGVYEKFNPTREFGREYYLLGRRAVPRFYNRIWRKREFANRAAFFVFRGGENP